MRRVTRKKVTKIMKKIKSIAALMIVLVIAALTVTTTAHAAAIAEDGKNELIATFIVMIGRAPSQAELADLVVARENGQSLVQVATKIATKIEFAGQYPGFMTADEFANKLVGTLIGDNATPEVTDWAKSWIKSQFNSGKTGSEVIAGAVQAVRSSTSSDYIRAKDALAAKVSAAVSKLSGSTQAETSADLVEKKKTAGSALKDLIEIAEDFAIEEEDDSAYYKQALAQSGKAEKPSVTLAKLQALQKELDSATTLARLNEVQADMKKLQDKMDPWVSFAGTNLNESSKNMTDEGLRNIRAINDRATSVLTGNSGRSCRSVYNTSTHSYQTVCN
jgi:hypothetical protein